MRKIAALMFIFFAVLTDAAAANNRLADLATWLDKLKNSSMVLNQQLVENIFHTTLDNVYFDISGPVEDIGSLQGGNLAAETGFARINYAEHATFQYNLLNLHTASGAKITLADLQNQGFIIFDIVPQSFSLENRVSVPLDKNCCNQIVYQFDGKNKYLSDITITTFASAKAKDLYDLVHQINQFERAQLGGKLNPEEIEKISGYQLTPIPQKARSIYDEEFSAGRYFGADGKRLDEAANSKKIIRDIFFGAINKDYTKHLSLTLNASASLTENDIVKIFGEPSRRDRNEYSEAADIQIYARPFKGSPGELAFCYDQHGRLQMVTLSYGAKIL